MHLIRLLLPLYDNDKQPFPNDYFGRVREDLANRFGGVTASVRSPAVGLWKESPGEINRDEVVMFEVLTEQLDKDWWADYRKDLQDRFRQEELIVWASNVIRL